MDLLEKENKFLLKMQKHSKGRNNFRSLLQNFENTQGTTTTKSKAKVADFQKKGIVKSD